MKSLKLTFAVLASGGLILLYSGCERHSWDDSAKGKHDGTKNLYHHGDGHKGADDGDTHEEPGGHGAEKKDAHGKEKHSG